MPRFPTQALGIAWSILILLALWGTRRGPARRWPAGALGAYAVSLAALGVFGLSFARGDPAPLMGGYRIDVVGAALVLVAATLVWVVRLRRGTPPAVKIEETITEAVTSPEPPATSASPADTLTHS